MKTIACLLVAALAVEGAPATPSPNECEWSDSLCRAERFSARAKAEKDPRRRAIAWNAACREFLAAHAKSGAVEELCAARRTCEASLATEGLAASVRSSLENARVRLEEREAAVGRPVCAKKSTQTPAGRERPRLAEVKRGAAKDDAAPAWMAASVGEIEATQSAERSGVAGGQVEAPRVAEADVTVPAREGERASGPSESRRRVEVDATADDMALLPVTRSSGVPPQESREGQPGRGLVIAGGVTLGLGLGLGGAAAFAGARAATVAREGFELQAAAMDRPLDEAMRRRDAELAEEYRGWTAATIGTAIAGGVAVVVGVTLVGVGRRRSRSTEAALVPVPGGLALHGRF
ncbi:MAG TPA: hypothetical protein PKW35_16610 [Nannocystaceae bacterium]|nr:hypothetical protein [Nannocystaceae bacterium]